MSDYGIGLSECASRKRITVPIQKNYVFLRQRGPHRQIGGSRDDLDGFALGRVGGSPLIEEVSDSARKDCGDEECGE